MGSLTERNYGFVMPIRCLMFCLYKLTTINWTNHKQKNSVYVWLLCSSVLCLRRSFVPSVLALSHTHCFVQHEWAGVSCIPYSVHRTPFALFTLPRQPKALMVVESGAKASWIWNICLIFVRPPEYRFYYCVAISRSRCHWHWWNDGRCAILSGVVFVCPAPRQSCVKLCLWGQCHAMSCHASGNILLIRLAERCMWCTRTVLLMASNAIHLCYNKCDSMANLNFRRRRPSARESYIMQSTVRAENGHYQCAFICWSIGINVRGSWGRIHRWNRWLRRRIGCAAPTQIHILVDVVVVVVVTGNCVWRLSTIVTSRKEWTPQCCCQVGKQLPGTTACVMPAPTAQFEFSAIPKGAIKTLSFESKSFHASKSHPLHHLQPSHTHIICGACRPIAFLATTQQANTPTNHRHHIQSS